MQSNGSPIKGRKISNQVLLQGKVLKKKTTSEVEIISKDLDQSFVILKHNSQYENLKSHMQQQQCNSDEKSQRKAKKKKSSERSAAIKKSQQLYSKKKKTSANIKKSVSAERVKSTEKSYISPEFVKRKKAATFFNNTESKPPISLQEHRKQLGLGFLNKVRTKKIDKILERNRLSSVERTINQSTPEKRKQMYSPNQMQELKHYMKEKKKFYSQIENVKHQSIVEKKRHIDDNLRYLAEVAAKRNSLSNSRSPQRDSNTIKSKPLMLSYVTTKNKKNKKKSGTKSLKDQFKQLEQRYKSLKIKNSIQSLNSDVSLRESRDYESEMKEQAAFIIQKYYRRHRQEQQQKIIEFQIQQQKQIEDNIKMTIISEEIKRWDDMKSVVLDLYKKKEILNIDDILDTFLQHINYNRENVGKIFEKSSIQHNIQIQPKEVFPPQIGQILNLRKELIQEREKKEKDLLKQMLIQERISPRSFGKKEEEIIKWSQEEHAQLVKSKEVIKEGWIKAYETIQKTQKDLRVIQKLGDDHFTHIMPLSVSQSNLLKNQLNGLKMNLIRSSYSEENLLEPQAQQQIIKSNVITYNSNTSNKSLNSYIQGLEDIPIDLDKQVRETPKQYQFFVQTHIAFIKNYLDEIKSIVLDQFNLQFLHQINIPIGPSAFEILKFFRMTEEMLEENLDGGFIHQPVLSLEIFTQREKHQVGQDEFMNELERIHNKSIFDAFNEALDYYRPFGIKGRPLPWRKQLGYTKIIEVGDNLDKAIKRVLLWSETLCGLIPPQKSIDNNDLLPQIREERLDKMLNSEIAETDDRWQEFDEELTEVSLELSELVFDSLITEMLGELVKPQEIQRFRVTN